MELIFVYLFSELALVTHKPRAATVCAVEKTRVAGKRQGHHIKLLNDSIEDLA